MSDLNKRVDTTVALWEDLYRVRVPQLALRTEDDMRFFGTRITGDAGIDREMANQLIDIMIPIAKMVEHHSNGVTVRVVFESDVKKIYDAIQAHIEAWGKNIQNNYNIGNVPVQDLINMNAFADTIFGHAKVHYMNNDSGSDFFRYLDTMSHARNRQPDAGAMSTEEQVKRLNEVTRPDFGDVFAKAAESGRTRRWN